MAATTYRHAHADMAAALATYLAADATTRAAQAEGVDAVLYTDGAAHLTRFATEILVADQPFTNTLRFEAFEALAEADDALGGLMAGGMDLIHAVLAQRLPVLETV